jgi:bifunctional non-homologous end joining protein LigD
MSVTLEISKPDKALFPDGLTKAELARYYERIAETMLPHVRGRPVHMQRFPDRIVGEEIQQKQAPDYFPDFVERVRVRRKRGGSVEHVVIENAETLVYLADQACITPHVCLSRRDRLDNPDRLIFDLESAWRRTCRPPGRAVCTSSRPSTAVPASTRLAPSPVSWRGCSPSGSRSASPSRQRKEKRRGRLYIDTARNAYAQTAVAPYAVRALRDAPVACPLEWRELGRVEPQQFTVRNLARRLARKDDPWTEIAGDARSLREPERRLARLQA